MKILFVCLGNICRSPSAEMIMKNLLPGVYIESAGTSADVGDPIYKLAREKLIENNINVDDNTKSRQLVKEDYEIFDYIIGMDNYNIRCIKEIVGEDVNNKISRLADYTDNQHDIADPWFTRDFETAYNDIYEGCKGLLEYLRGI